MVRVSAAEEGIRTVFERNGAPPPDLSRIPEVKPPITSMFLSTEGELWVRTAVEEGAPTRYDIYGSDGRLLGAASATVAPWPPLDPVVTGDHFWAVVVDEVDVLYVVRARIERGPPDPP